MSARLTGRGWGVVAVLIGSIALGFALRYPEAVGIGMGTLVLLVVAYFLVSGGGPVWATATAQPRVERRADTAVRVDVDAARAHRRGLRLVAPGALAHPVVWDETGIHADVPIPTQRRGPVSLGPWSLERVDPWGLLRRRVGEAEGVAVLVIPRVRPVSLATLPSALADFGGSAEMGTTTFATLREYVVGDELRHVHWRSSAKTGTLMMRQYIDVTRPRITLVLVVEERAYTSEDEFEGAVDFLASLAAVASSSGLDVDVCTTTGERASHGGGRSSAVLDLLALVEQGSSGVDTRLLRAHRATTVVVRGHGSMGWWDR
ncbi:MAG: DUF58 domain-containing protein, partial [Candidatus Nanopelagicales bacterium]|nr:DUF58 domain-containing protein [Candidatus Nanopelagicales bacterium]